MSVYKQTEKALRVYGELKRTNTAGGDATREFMERIAGALSQLPTNEQYTLQNIYMLGMTQEEAAFQGECDVSTISRRKVRALERVALMLFPDQYINEKGL